MLTSTKPRERDVTEKRERKDRWEGERERRRKKQRGIKGPRNRLRKTDVLSGIRSKPSKYISWNSISRPKKKNRERGGGVKERKRDRERENCDVSLK